MSAIASFILLPRAALSELRDTTVAKEDVTYRKILDQAGHEVADYQWSGYVLATLLCCLKENHRIDLLRSPHDELAGLLTQARGSTHVIFTKEHKDAYLDKVDPSSLSVEKLRDYYNKFNNVDEPDAGMPMLDGVRAIQQSLAQLDDSSVILLVIE
jgi:hypothetical protein